MMSGIASRWSSQTVAAEFKRAHRRLPFLRLPGNRVANPSERPVIRMPAASGKKRCTGFEMNVEARAVNVIFRSAVREVQTDIGLVRSLIGREADVAVDA